MMTVMIPMILLKYSFFDGACYAYGQDANMNYAYGDELAIVPYVKHEIVSIAPTHDSPIIVSFSQLHYIRKVYTY